MVERQPKVWVSTPPSSMPMVKPSDISMPETPSARSRSRPSRKVLDAVSRVLRLDASERRHLYLLAGLNPPLPEAVQQPVTDGLRRLIEAWMPFPAHVMDRYWNIVSMNDAAGLVFGYGEGDTNCLASFFLSPIYRERAADWQQNAASVVAQFRVLTSEHPGDPAYQLIVDELAHQSAEFAELWQRRDVQAAGQLGKVVRHPTAGLLHFESTQLRVPARPDLAIVLHTPLPDTGTAEQLEWLTSPEGRRATIRSAG